MALRNHTPFSAELVPMIDATGRNVAVVIVKATYLIDLSGDQRLLEAPEQEPLVFADERRPAQVGPVWLPSDLITEKASTDVLLVGPEAGLARSPLRGKTLSVRVGPVLISGKVGDRWPFGPLGPEESPRREFAGTYDAAWAENRMPLLPDDFDARHFQVARPSQIASRSLRGDETVTVEGVYGAGTVVRTVLPAKSVVVAGSVLSYYFSRVAPLDTIAVYSDRPLLTMVWRQVIRPRQKIEELGDTYVYVVRLRTAQQLYGDA